MIYPNVILPTMVKFPLWEQWSNKEHLTTKQSQTAFLYDKVGWDLCNGVNRKLWHNVSTKYIISNSFSQLRKTGKMIYTVAALDEMTKISPQYMYFRDKWTNWAIKFSPWK